MTQTKKPIFIILALWLSTGTIVARETVERAGPGWFVLRHSVSGQCWTARLVRIRGSFRQGRAGRVAAGPFKKEADALQRLKSLLPSGTCIVE